MLGSLSTSLIILLEALLYATLNQLVDALTGLERILTTPIPFSCVIIISLLVLISCSLLSSSLHLWVVTMAYCAALVRSVSPPLPVS
jgi:predicted membrane chloride channel (bestrophin family)